MKNLQKIKDEILSIIFKYIPKDDCAVFLFGSFAKKEIYSSSDIDIGVICNKPLEGSIKVYIKDELEQIKTLRDIDFVDFASITDKDFLKIALKEVKIWHQTRKSKIFLSNLKKRIKD